MRRNITYGCIEDRYLCRVKGRDTLTMLGIAHLSDRFPGQISGGEKQRVALARALMAGPELLLLDESLSALDPDTRSKLQQKMLLVQQKTQIPFVMVTHDVGEAELMGDRIIRIENGRIQQ